MPDVTSVDLGLLILRLVVGGTFAAHGFAKVFSGGRLPGTGRWFDSIGMRPGPLHARMAAGTEILAGLGLAAGALTSLAGAAMVSVMLVAAWTLHRKDGFFIVRNGWEYNLVLAAVGVSVAVTGPGSLSLDEVVLGGALMSGWWGFAVSAVLGSAAGAAHLLIFYRPPALVETA